MKYCGEELFSELPGRHILWRRIDHQAVCSALPLCSSNLIDFDCDIAQTAFGVVIFSSFFLPFFPSVLLRPGFRSTSRTNQNKETVSSISPAKLHFSAGAASNWITTNFLTTDDAANAICILFLARVGATVFSPSQFRNPRELAGATAAVIRD